MKFIWRILPYGIVRWYAMKHCKNTVIVQSGFFGHNDCGVKGGNCKQFNLVYLGNGLYYLANPTAVMKAKIKHLRDEIESLEENIKVQDEFKFNEYRILTEDRYKILTEDER